MLAYIPSIYIFFLYFFFKKIILFYYVFPNDVQVEEMSDNLGPDNLHF